MSGLANPDPQNMRQMMRARRLGAVRATGLHKLRTLEDVVALWPTAHGADDWDLR